MHLSPDPDFEEFALDCIRLSNQEKSPILRGKLLTLARVVQEDAVLERQMPALDLPLCHRMIGRAADMRHCPSSEILRQEAS